MFNMKFEQNQNVPVTGWQLREEGVKVWFGLGRIG